MSETTELLQTTDARVWAEQFIVTMQKNGWTLEDIDESLMLTWFANAMCAQMDKSAADLSRLRKRAEKAEARVKELEEQRNFLLEWSEQIHLNGDELVWDGTGEKCINQGGG